MKSKNAFVWQVIVALCLTALAFLLFRECKKPVDVSGTRKEVDSINAAMRSDRERYNVAVGCLNKTIDSLKEQQHNTRIKANQAESEIQRLIARGSEIVAKAPPEIRHEATFDSLASVNQELSSKVVAYQNIIKTNEFIFQQQLDKKDSTIFLQGQLLFDLQNKVIDISSKYYQVEKDLVKTDKKLRRNRTLNRILAGAVIVASGIAIAK